MKYLLIVIMAATFVACDKDKTIVNEFPPEAVAAVEVRTDSIIFTGYGSKMNINNIPLKAHTWEFWKMPAAATNSTNLIGQRVAAKRFSGSWGATYWVSDAYGNTSIDTVSFVIP